MITIKANDINLSKSKAAQTLATDPSVPAFYYCSCEAGPIQMEIDSLKESIQYALDQASEESKEFEKRREAQIRQIDILTAKIKESKERECNFWRQFKDTKKDLEEIKTSYGSSTSLITSFNPLLNLSLNEITSSESSRRVYQSAKIRRRSSFTKKNNQSGGHESTSDIQGGDIETRQSDKNALNCLFLLIYFMT